MTQQELDALKAILEGKLRKAEMAWTREERGELASALADLNGQASW